MAKPTIDGRVREVETALWGAERNGDSRSGFVAETRECLKIIRTGMTTFDGRMRGVETKLTTLLDRRTGLRAVLIATIPALIVGGASVLAVILTRGLP